MNIGSLDASPKIHATLLIEYSEGGLQTKVVLGDGTNSISLAGKADVKGADIELNSDIWDTAMTFALPAGVHLHVIIIFLQY